MLDDKYAFYIKDDNYVILHFSESDNKEKNIKKLFNSNGMTLDDIKNKIKETDDFSQIHNLFLIKGGKT